MLNKGIAACFALASGVYLAAIESAAAEPDYSRFEAVVRWLNQQLVNADYPSIISDQICQTDRLAEIMESACTYKYADTGYLMLAQNSNELISFNLMVTLLGEEFEVVERDSMYLFSLLIWGTMDQEASIEDANALLSEIYRRSFEVSISEQSAGHWSFAISDTDICGIPTLVLAGQNLKTGFDAQDQILSKNDYHCPLVIQE